MMQDLCGEFDAILAKQTLGFTHAGASAEAPTTAHPPALAAMADFELL